MKRRLFVVASMLSLVLAIVFLIAWPLSHYYAFSFTTTPVRVTAAHGLFVWESSPAWIPNESAAFDFRPLDDDKDLFLLFFGLVSEEQWSVAGVTFHRTYNLRRTLISDPVNTATATSPYDGWVIQIPLAYLGLPGCLLPLIWWFFVRKTSPRYRSAHGLCVGCGYDVRASVGACPECGRCG